VLDCKREPADLRATVRVFVVRLALEPAVELELSPSCWLLPGELAGRELFVFFIGGDVNGSLGMREEVSN
jgi:hypothetical protein